jgi:hypothetical protein
MTISRIVDKPISPALEGIAYEEGNHFTKKRVKDIVGTFIMLLIAVFFMKNEIFNKKDQISNTLVQASAFIMFCGYCAGKT